MVELLVIDMIKHIDCNISKICDGYIYAFELIVLKYSNLEDCNNVRFYVLRHKYYCFRMVFSLAYMLYVWAKGLDISGNDELWISSENPTDGSRKLP